MFNKTEKSLTDLLGKEYAAAVKTCAMTLHGLDEEAVDQLLQERIAFFPEKRAEHLDSLLQKVGQQIVPPFINENKGAATQSFMRASHLNAAPLCGIGPYRVGEDGRLYYAAKSEHYHTSLGHLFAGYQLVEHAKKLGIPNATHNNTRGFITRHMERELIRHVNGLAVNDQDGLESVLVSKEPRVLNRIINLQTGSLAVEAGVKMMLRRFYRLEPGERQPVHDGRIPVFLVIADLTDGPEANYHGTTIVTQTMRGLWPDLLKQAQGAYRVVSVRQNDIHDFKDKIDQYNQGEYRTAGFMHEIILMNYGAIQLDKAYLQAAYELCHQYQTPVLVDEIQSCMWYSGMFLFKHYQLQPDFVILGKGFSGGEYPASKVMTTYEMDSMTQFGALVTNGQEELASLAYLVTMSFVIDHAAEIDQVGSYIDKKFNELRLQHPALIDKIEGQGHLVAIHFMNLSLAARFASLMNAKCIDVSAQTYKTNCPPAALMKLPMIASVKAINYLTDQMADVMDQLAQS